MNVFFTHPIEIVWLTVSVVVMTLSVWALREAIVDSAFMVAHNINGPRKVVADASIREESIKVGISIVMLVAATASNFFPPPPPEYSEMPQLLIAMLAWNAAALLMAVSSLLNRTVRRKLAQYAPVSVNREVGTVEPGAGVVGRAEDMRTESKAAEDRGGDGPGDARTGKPGIGSREGG